MIPSCFAVSRDVARPHDRRQLREDRVVGVRDRLVQVDRPEVLALVVVDLPEPAVRVDRDRVRVEHARRRDVVLERGREHERLERRARLPLALRRQVELVLVVVLAADHRDAPRPLCASSTTIVAVGPVSLGGRTDLIASRAICCRPTSSVVVTRSPPRTCGPGQTCDELILDVVREVRRRDALRRRQVHLVGLRHRVDERVLVLALRQVALGVEEADHEVPALLRVLRVCDRVVGARVLGDRGEQRRLGRLHHRGAVVEVDARGLLDAVGAVPEVDGVQVRGEDLVLRPALLELPGEGGLTELAADRLLVRQVRVLDELLGDRRAALHGAAMRHVGPERARHAAHVDAAVLVEALVLGRDDRVLHPRG